MFVDLKYNFLIIIALFSVNVFLGRFNYVVKNIVLGIPVAKAVQDLLRSYSIFRKDVDVFQVGKSGQDR